MKQYDEEKLMAYHLGDLSRWDQARVRRKLESDPALAAQSEEIAATLRAFAGDAVEAPEEGAAERAWQKIRPSLAVLEPLPRSGKGWFWVGTSVGALATAVLLAVVVWHSLRIVPAGPGAAGNGAALAAKSWSAGLLDELHTHKTAGKPGGQQLNQRPGPLTNAPADAVAEDPALATHLDTAERVLTEVSHTEGNLPDETRLQVHRLLLENAMYHQTAETHGDLATAAVIDDLGRVLISLDAEPQNGRGGEEGRDAFRLQMNLGGVLLDLRILHHNDAPLRGQ